MQNTREGSATYTTKTGQRIQAESIMFRRFDHPTIPVFIQLKPDALVLSAVVGKPLESIVPRFSELQENQRTNMFTSLLYGLQHIHSVFVVHGNINLQTIYVQDRGMKPIFVNFESSFLQGQDTCVAENGCYMAPETRRSG